ncbi:MAG: tetratricopeptide repeat protein, partial [Bacteroidia bacterium]
MMLVRLTSCYIIIGLLLTPLELWSQEDNFRYGKQLLEEGEALEYFFKYEEALPLYEQAADCFSEIDSLRLESYSLESLGNIQIELGVYHLAKVSFEEALLIAQKANYQLEIISAKEGLAKLLYYDGDEIESIARFKEVIPARAALLGEYDIELAINNNYVGSMYGNRGDYELASAYFTKGLEIRIHNLGPDNKLLASSYYNLGTSFSIQGDYNQALDYFSKALYLVKKHHGEENLHLFSVYNGLGAAYLGLGQLDKAETHLKKADHIAKKKLGADNLRRQFVLMNFAELARARFQLDSTMIYLNERLVLQQKHLPPAHHSTILTLSKMGHIYAENQYPQKGLAFLEQAEKLIEIDQEGRANDEKAT